MLELYGIKLKIPESVYEPAEDTFLLISALVALDLSRKTCLEIGCGSGLVALFLAKKAKKVVAVDINPDAVACAKENAVRNNIKNAEFVKSDLFSNVTGTFDLIVFNPPYLPDERFIGKANKAENEATGHCGSSLQSRRNDGDEPDSRDIALDGGKDGRKTISRFLRAVPKFLNLKKKSGLFILESSLSQYGKTIEYLNAAGLNAEVVAREQLEWESLVVIRAIPP